MCGERGQATIEWVGLVLVAALALGALAALVTPLDARAFGGFLAHRIACAARGGCDDGDVRLARSHGPRDAALLRRHAPNLVYEPGERQLPVHWRRCRARGCADAPDDRDADVSRTHAGERATVFTHVVRRRGHVYLQYWLYYPDSNSTVAGVDRVWERSVLLPAVGRLVNGSSRWPGFHRDDWESFHIRLDPDGGVWARSSSHGHYQTCKHARCRDAWAPSTGWTRVSKGSHAGHFPEDPGARERITSSDRLRLIPLDARARRGYRPNDDGIKPPWRKRVYREPESDES